MDWKEEVNTSIFGILLNLFIYTAIHVTWAEVAISQLPNSDMKWRGTTLAYQMIMIPTNLIFNDRMIPFSIHTKYESDSPPTFLTVVFLGLSPFVSFSLCTIAPNQKFDSEVQSQFLITILMISCTKLMRQLAWFVVR